MVLFTSILLMVRLSIRAECFINFDHTSTVSENFWMATRKYMFHTMEGGEAFTVVLHYRVLIDPFQNTFLCLYVCSVS